MYFITKYALRLCKTYKLINKGTRVKKRIGYHKKLVRRNKRIKKNNPKRVPHLIRQQATPTVWADQTIFVTDKSNKNRSLSALAKIPFQ